MDKGATEFFASEIEKWISAIKPAFIEHFGTGMVSKDIKVIAWMFFLNEYLMGYAVHGNKFEAFMKEVDAMKFKKEETTNG